MDKLKRNLMTQIWELYDLDSLEDAVFNNDSAEYLKDAYDLQERKDMYDSLKWAEENPSFKFEGIMENAPVIGKLKFTNEEVYKYLMLFKNFMEKEQYKLLLEDRELKKPEDYI